MKKIWPFSFYFLYFAAFASLLPFLVIFYQQLKFTGTQIGLLTGVPPLVTLVCAPLLTGLADRSNRHKLIMGIGLAVPLLVVAVMPTLHMFIIVFLVILMFNICIAPVSPLADTATLTMLGEERAMYGRIRMGGTFGWGIFALLAGVVFERFGLPILFYIFSAITLLNLFVSQKFSFARSEKHASEQGGLRTLLSSRRWVFFLLAALLGGVGASTVAVYLSPYMQQLGANGDQIGIALIIATATEFPVFYVGNRLVKKFGSSNLFLIALILIGVRSILYAVASTPVMIYAVQAFSGMIFPAMWSAGVAFADENAPAGLKSTAQGIFGAMSFGFGSAVGGLLGGPLLENLGGRGMYLVFGIIILVGVILIEGVKRLLPEQELVQPEVL